MKSALPKMHNGGTLPPPKGSWRTPLTKPVFADKSVLSLGAFFSSVLVLGGFIWWLSSQNSKLETVVTDVKLIKESLAKRDQDGVSHQDMRVFIQLLRGQNPGMKIPDWLK